MAATHAPGDSTEIATLRIELEYSDPLIWREVEIPTSVTLATLHGIVQAAMDWDDQHLWEFTVGRESYGPASDGGWGVGAPRPASRARLSDLLSPNRTRIGYTYDFGDGWEHRLVVRDVRPGDPGTAYPRFVGGERNAPPEDCGGIPGFYHMLSARADPSHPDHAEMDEWHGDYDPDAPDVETIEARLGRIAARRRPAAKRSGSRTGG